MAPHNNTDINSFNLDNLRAYQIDKALYPKSHEVYRGLELSVDAFDDAYKKNNSLDSISYLKEILLTKWDEISALAQYEPTSPLLTGNLTKDLKTHYFNSTTQLRYYTQQNVDKTVFTKTQSLAQEYGLSSIEFGAQDTAATKLQKLDNLKRELDKFARKYQIADKRQVGLKTRLHLRLENPSPENSLLAKKIEKNNTITLLGTDFKFDKRFMLKYLYELDLYAGQVLFHSNKPASEHQILAKSDLNHPELEGFETLKNSLVYSSVKHLKPSPEGDIDLAELERKYFYVPQLDLAPEPEPISHLDYIIEPEVAQEENLEQNLENQLAQQYQTSVATSFEVAQKDMSEVNRVELAADMEQVLQTNLEAQALLQESTPEPELLLDNTQKVSVPQPARISPELNLTQKITATRNGQKGLKLVNQPAPSVISNTSSAHKPFQTRVPKKPLLQTARKTTGGASGPAYVAIAKAQQSYDINKTMDDMVRDRLEEKETTELDGHERELQFLFNPEKARRMHKYLENSSVVPGTSKLKPVS